MVKVLADQPPDFRCANEVIVHGFGRECVSTDKDATLDFRPEESAACGGVEVVAWA